MMHKLSLLLIFLAFTVACGSSGGEAAGGTDGARSLVMNGTVEITGDAMVSGAFTRTSHSRQPSCAMLASEGSSADDSGTEGTFLIPGPRFGTPLQPSGDVYAANLQITADIYDGPRTYVNNDTITEIEGQIVLEQTPDGPAYFVDEGMATAIVMPDGSGSITFEDLPQTAGAATRISGEVTWTCTD